MIENITSHCFNCNDRILGCHSKCNRYSDYRCEIERKNKLMSNNKNVDADSYWFDRNSKADKRISKNNRWMV